MEIGAFATAYKTDTSVWLVDTGMVLELGTTCLCHPKIRKAAQVSTFKASKVTTPAAQLFFVFFKVFGKMFEIVTLTNQVSAKDEGQKQVCDILDPLCSVLG